MLVVKAVGEYEMFTYDGRMYQDDVDYSRVIMKGFLNHFEETEDAMFYLIKGLEMLHHELSNKCSDSEKVDIKEWGRVRRLQSAIEELKGKNSSCQAGIGWYNIPVSEEVSNSMECATSNERQQ